MSALGFVHFSPTTTHFPRPIRPLAPPQTLLISLASKPLKQKLHLFVIHSQSQPTIQLEEEKANEVEEEEEEVSDIRVLLQNVPWTCTADDLRPLLEKYGTVVDIEFSMYNKSRNRGLAFVTMSSPEEALAVMNNLDSSEFDGRILKLNWARPKKEKPSSPPQPKQPKLLPVHNLFVANLPFQARAKDIKEFFNSDNANVVSAEVIFTDSPNRRSAGYGFVSFNTKAEAEAALAAFEGKEFMGRPIRVARSKRFLRQETKATIETESDKNIETESDKNIETESDKNIETESDKNIETESDIVT